MDYAKGSFSRNIPHPSLITLLCIKGGVKFNEEEERCPKAPPLTLPGVLKALVQSEEGEMRVKPTKKRKRAETEEQRDRAPILVSDKGDNNEKGGFAETLEQPMLSLIADHGAPSQTGVEERGEEIKEESKST